MTKQALDPTKLADWEVAEAAEKDAKPITQIADELGLADGELIPMGNLLGKVDFIKVLDRLADKPDGKYVDVTAITPTPLGEGKTTTSMGLVQGLGRIGKNVVGAIRQPSGGPTFNIKGSAAGGGLAQCIPLTPFSIRLTGDIDSITNAHNLAMVALTGYDDVIALFTVIADYSVRSLYLWTGSIDNLKTTPFELFEYVRGLSMGANYHNTRRYMGN